MIFIVTGTQEPFDRLLKIVDRWYSRNKGVMIVAQTGKSTFSSKNMKCFDYLEPDVFIEYFNNADVIIGHAGIGTIIEALENKKKLVVFPRLLKYNEHRNNHQLHTAKGFDELGLINVAYNENELLEYLDDLDSILKKEKIDNKAEQKLIDSLFTFINK